jgi:hypothetical protein
MQGIAFVAALVAMIIAFGCVSPNAPAEVSAGISPIAVISAT